MGLSVKYSAEGLDGATLRGHRFMIIFGMPMFYSGLP
jgi:hypothetical protein